MRPFLAKRAFTTVLLGFLGTSMASASVTVATFADPASSSATPVFTFTGSIAAGGTLTGGWAVPGLTLETPGVPAPDFPDAEFSMAAVNVLPGGLNTGPGTIIFTDSGGTEQLRITFTAGHLASPIGFGGSDFIGDNVTFSGPIVGTDPIIEEQFSFSFANPVLTPNGYSVTAAFTSSATIIPEPASLVLVGLGALGLLRRR